ncbi:MAG: sortase [Pseudonocardiales bacterium]|nr:MAG: sortase [Pseudonocardiales bacterium]
MASAMLAAVLFLPSSAGAAGASVGLGTAASYSVLGGQTVTNTGPTTLNANLGVSPGTAITGFPPGKAGGAIHAGDAAALQAKSDLVIAYNDAAGRAKTADIADDLVGRTLIAGVYKSTGPIRLSGTLTLDAQGDPSAVFIFQIPSTLITASASRVSMINGAQACHVFWQVGSSATLGTTSKFVGTIMALTSISVTTGTVVNGRALARNGQVSLDNNTFTSGRCDTTPPGTTPPPTTPPVTTPPVTTPPVTPTDTATDTASEQPGPQPHVSRGVTTGTTPTSPPTSTPTSTATVSRAVVVPRASSASTSTTARASSAVGLTSAGGNLANTGLSPMLKPLLGLGAVLSILGASLLLAGGRTRTAYCPRHSPIS